MGLMKRAPQHGKDDEQVFYTTALPQEQADGCSVGTSCVLLRGGEYVMFTYEGVRNRRAGFYPDHLHGTLCQC